MHARESAKNALAYVMGAIPGESVVVVADDVCSEIAEAFLAGANDIGLWARLMLLKTGKEPRSEVPSELSELIASGRGDIFITMFRESEMETPFRIRIITLISRYRKYRLGHCPGITLDMLTEGGLALSGSEHLEMQAAAERLISRLASADSIRITAPSGTDATLSVHGRPFKTDAKFDWETFKWGNLPTGEVWAAPVENSLEGTIVCDMAIGGIGQVRRPLKIIAKGGRAVSFESDDKDVLRRVESALAVDEMARVVGEFAIGLNRKARVSANFLEAEKLGNTIHVALGHNTDMPGGRNTSATHMDFLVSEPTVEVTDAKGNRFTIMESGRVL